MTQEEFGLTIGALISALRQCDDTERARYHADQLMQVFDEQSQVITKGRVTQYNQALDLEARDAELVALRPLKPIADAARLLVDAAIDPAIPEALCGPLDALDAMSKTASD